MDFYTKRYEQFGWDYEQANPITEKEIAWYLNFAKKTGGPVLELACGTGRLLTAIAQAGFDVEGIDLSSGMLKIASKHISQLPSEAASHIRLHNINMVDFELDSKFSLIVIADNSFSELKTGEQQISCLRCVQRHLQPGGKLLVTVRRFEPSSFSNGRRMLDWSEPFYHPVTHETVQRRGEMTLVENEKKVKGTFFYKTTHRDGSETVEEYPFESPVMYKEDYIALFSEAGFYANVYAGYEEQPDDGKNPILCFACDKTL